MRICDVCMRGDRAVSNASFTMVIPFTDFNIVERTRGARGEICEECASSLIETVLVWVEIRAEAMHKNE